MLLLRHTLFSRLVPAFDSPQYSTPSPTCSPQLPRPLIRQGELGHEGVPAARAHASGGVVVPISDGDAERVAGGNRQSDLDASRDIKTAVFGEQVRIVVERTHRDL